jgi:uncharacterized damage-inducible protein DinB
MNHADLTTMLEFHYWARDRVLEAVEKLTPEQYTRDLGSSFRSVRDTLVHLLSADSNWLKRWRGTSPTTMLDPAEFPDVATLRTAWTAQEAQIRSFLASLDDNAVTRAIDYKTLDGKPFTSAFWEMLHHVVNHGTYHRGQVQTMLRQLGATPARSVDAITFYRERNAASSRV